MTIVALFSAKGAPGVTTIALGLAAGWGDQVVLVEADPYGGDVAARCEVSDRRDLGPVAIRARYGLDLGTLDAHVCTATAATGESFLAILGVREPEQGMQTGQFWSEFVRVATGAGERTWIVDLGRYGPGHPATDVMRHADVIVLVTRPDIASVFHSSRRVQAVRAVNPSARLFVASVGVEPYPPVDVARTLEVDTDSVVLIDVHPPGAAALNYRPGSGPRYRASALSASIATLKRHVRSHVASDVTTAAP